MTIVFKDILTKQQCNTIANAMIYLYENEIENLNYEKDDCYYNGSYGFRGIHEAEQLLPIIEEKVLKHYTGYTFDNVYTRIYKNESTLNVHTDRQDLDLTLTVCVYSDISVSWPIHVSNIPHQGEWNFDKSDYYKSDFKSFNTPIGTGVSCLGRIYAHWRDKLVCQENEKVVQVFYHWKKI